MEAKKSLGQHFLRNTKALLTIVEAARLQNTDTVLEIGPGEGVLTELLLEKARKVVAIEKDRELIETLKERFKVDIENGKLILVEQDIRNVGKDLSAFLPSSYILIANIPYYLTGFILKEYVGGDYQPERVVLLLQKEVVERIVAADNKESILSISIKAYGKPQKVGLVKKGSFVPQPKVDSAILFIDSISRAFFGDISEKNFLG